MSIYIKAAAIRRDDGVVVTDRCHYRCIIKSPKGTCNSAEVQQGFVTSEDEFICRQDARYIAWAAGQINEELDGDALFSEEIWSSPGRLCAGTGKWRWDEAQMSYVKIQ